MQFFFRLAKKFGLFLKSQFFHQMTELHLYWGGEKRCEISMISFHLISHYFDQNKPSQSANFLVASKITSKIGFENKGKMKLFLYPISYQFLILLTSHHIVQDSISDISDSSKMLFLLKKKNMKRFQVSEMKRFWACRGEF